MDKNFVNVDDLVRQRLGGGEERERAGSWLQMKDLLDKEMPQEKPAGMYWKRMLGVVAVGALLAGLSVGGYEVNSFVRRTVGDVHPAMAEGVAADDAAMHDAGVSAPAATPNADNHTAANVLSDNAVATASESNNNVSSSTSSPSVKQNATGNNHKKHSNNNNTHKNTANNNNNHSTASTVASTSAVVSAPETNGATTTAGNTSIPTNDKELTNSAKTAQVANNTHVAADNTGKPSTAAHSVAASNKPSATKHGVIAPKSVKAPSNGGVSASGKQAADQDENSADNSVTTSKQTNGSASVGAVAANTPKVTGRSIQHTRNARVKTAGLAATKSTTANGEPNGTEGAQIANNGGSKPANAKNTNGLHVLSASAPVAKANATATPTTKGATVANVKANKNRVVADKNEPNANRVAHTGPAKTTVPAQVATGNGTQIAGSAAPAVAGVDNGEPTKTGAPVAVKQADDATTRNNKIAEENQRLAAARTAQMNNKRNEAKLRLRALNSKLKSINNTGAATPEMIADNAVAGAATPAAVKPGGGNTAGATARSKSIMNRLPVAGKSIATNGLAGAPAAKTIAFPTGGSTAGNAGATVKPNVLSSSAGAAKTMPVAGKPVAGGTIPGGVKQGGNATGSGKDADGNVQTRGKRVIERLTILQQYVRTAPNEGYLNMDTISRETLTQEFGMTADADPAAANARKSGSVLAASSNSAQSVINKLVPTPSTISTSKTVSGSIKEMPLETSASTSQSLENLSAAFNDIKTKVGAIQFAPGLIAGINGTFFGPANFKGFHFGITGNIIFDPNWNVMVELRYFNRINNDYAMNDDYYNYTSNGTGGYTKQLQTNSYSFATLHSLELPVALRFTAGNFNFYGGGNVAYNFAVNTGAAASPTTVDPVVVSAIGTDNQPKLKASDFDARIGVGYLFGASFQAGPNVSFDFRSVQNVWDNAQSTGGKAISKELYKNPSFQISFGYRLGGNKENK